MYTLIGIVLPLIVFLIWAVVRASGRKQADNNSNYQPPSLPFTQLSTRNTPIVFPAEEMGKDSEDADEELEKLVAALPPDSPARLSRTTDPMDDHPILTLTVGAVHVEGAKANDGPVLVLRANKRGVEIRHDVYVHVGERFFFRKGKEIGMRIRLDEAEPFSVKTSLSTNLSAVFIKLPEQIICAAANCSRLKVQIIPEHGGAVLAIFDFEIVRPVVDLFLKAVFGSDAKSICMLNPEVVHWCLIMGPKNTYLKKLALKERGIDPGPLDYVKRLSFFQAAERYAQVKQSSEITGNIIDLGWTYHLHQETSESIRAAMGPLTINK